MIGYNCFMKKLIIKNTVWYDPVTDEIILADLTVLKKSAKPQPRIKFPFSLASVLLGIL